MSARRINVRNAVAMGFLLSCFLMRPSALGQRYSIVAIIFSCLLFVTYSFGRYPNLGSKDSQIFHHMRLLGVFTGVYLIYEVAISLIFNMSDLDFVAKEVGTTLVVGSAYAAYLVDRENNRRFFLSLTAIISALGYSAALTFLVAQFLGVDALYLFSVAVKGYESSSDAAMVTGAVYFPLTMLYNQFTSGDVELLRVSGFFREAGIYQAICCYCLACEIFTRRSMPIIIGLLMGVVAAFSTAGIAVMLVTFGLIFLFYGKRSRVNIVYFLIFVILAYPVALYTPYIGLEAKTYTHSTSISDRSTAMSEGWKEFSNNPLGNGLFSGKKENSGINLIASVGAIGFVGFILQVVILSGWRFGFTSSNQKKMIACFPLLATALFSQPIAAAPLMYILTMVSFD